VFVSPDGGETWNPTGVAVGSTDVDPDARRVMTMAVNDQGVVGIMIVERRAQSEHCLATQFAASADGGITFSRAKTVSTSLCRPSSSEQLAVRRFPTYGDYFGLVGLPDGAFRLMWPEMRNGVSTLLSTVASVKTKALPSH